ncbi:MAG: hypothetical protein A3D74_02810 [Candidatus Levybacteria bacterium RIFCSPHIGHO2_02_FULL_37_13]|nr:MAG: hypothetical protein A3D74_02810 [Candidatus Levybacteria bacterium RIFCSPHIGHO2_02_FULL_37_13]OGH40309.1 MAG: hypothetical protein A3B41_00065 [Candidatus Levybacteria bacterium RIFCSPLOWO2_01_FULL_37_26]
MNKREFFVVFLILFFVTAIFFYKTFLHGLVSFPGDLLIAEYNPWKTYSYLGYNPGSYPNKAQYFDVLRQLYPWKTFAVDLIKQGILPLWNPYNFSGAPLISNFQSAVFYPLGIFYLILPQISAWTFLVIAQPLFATFFTYLFSRKIGISKIGSLLAAISFAFSSFMSVWLEYNIVGHVILWLPLSLLAIEMLLKKATTQWIIILIASIVFSLLAGHPQIFAYSLVFILAYLIFRIFNLRKLLFFLLLVILAVGIGAMQVIPGIELIKESARVSHDYNFLIHKILIQPWQFIMMIVPDFFGNPATRNYWIEDTYIGKVTYIGLIPLLFVLFSFKNIKKSFIFFFTAIGGLILLISSHNPFTAILYKFNLPFVSSSAPTLSIFLFCFCISILSGFGIDIYRFEKWRITKTIKIIAPLILVILFLWIVVLLVPHLISDRLSQHLIVVKRNLLYATFLIGIGTFLILVGTLKRKMIFLVLILLLILQTGDLFRYFTKFNPFVPKELVFPNAPVLEFLKKESGIDRFWGYGSAAIEANFATQYGIYSTDGYDPLYPKRYGEFIQTSENGKIGTEFTGQTRSDAFIARDSGETDLSSNIYRLKILDILGVRYVLDRVENGSTEKTFPSDRFKLIYEKDEWKIFENQKALPRAFLASEYKVFNSNEEFEEIFFDKNFDPSKTILLEGKPSSYSSIKEVPSGTSESRSSRQARTVSLVSYKPNQIIFSTNNQSNQLLFLSDTYYPGWKAFVDAKETKIYRANYAFRAVVVPEGKHNVIMKYDPDSFRVGMGISTISFILTLILLIFLRIRPKSITM